MTKVISIKDSRIRKDRENKEFRFKLGYSWAINAYMLGEKSLLEIETQLEGLPMQGSYRYFEHGAALALEELIALEITPYHKKRPITYAGKI